MRENCKFRGKDGWCDLLFHRPEELERMCPICSDYTTADECHTETNIQKDNHYQTQVI